LLSQLSDYAQESVIIIGSARRFSQQVQPLRALVIIQTW